MRPWAVALMCGWCGVELARVRLDRLQTFLLATFKHDFKRCRLIKSMYPFQLGTRQPIAIPVNRG